MLDYNSHHPRLSDVVAVDRSTHIQHIFIVLMCTDRHTCSLWANYGNIHYTAAPVLRKILQTPLLKAATLKEWPTAPNVQFWPGIMALICINVHCHIELRVEETNSLLHVTQVLFYLQKVTWM